LLKSIFPLSQLSSTFKGSPIIADSAFWGEGKITVQEYEHVSYYLDKIFSGEVHLYKQYDQERLIALAAKVTNVKGGDDLAELRSYLVDLERNHRSTRNYEQINFPR
jgi:hypothetical protein